MSPSQRTIAKHISEDQTHILEAIASGVALPDVLDRIARAIENLAEPAHATILLLDHDNQQLRFGAAPSLPQPYTRAMDGLKIGPDACSCGAAAFHNAEVVAADIASDPLWHDHRDLALAHGLRACWATPIRATSGAVLGTFALYYETPRAPTEEHRRLISVFTHLASIAIERDNDAAALHASESRLRMVLDHAPLGIAKIALDGDIEDCNSRFCELLGYDHAEMIGSPYQRFLTEDGMEATSGTTRELIDNGKANVGVDARLLRKDGTSMWASVNTSLVRDPHGEPLFYVAICEDITERHEHNRQTRESLDALLELAHMLVSITDTQQSIETTADIDRPLLERIALTTLSLTSARRIALMLIDQDSQTLIPVLRVSVVSQGDDTEWMTFVKNRPVENITTPQRLALLRDDHPIAQLVTIPSTAHGVRKGDRRTIVLAPMLINHALIGLVSLDFGLNEDEITDDIIGLSRTVAHFVTLVVDRGRLMRDREQAIEGEDAMRRANLQMDEFLSVVSHELRGPLALIRGNTQLAMRRLLRFAGALEAGALDLDQIGCQLDGIHELLDRADLQVGLENRIVSDLLDASRIQANHLELLRVPCDIAELARRVAEEQSRLYSKRTIQCEAPHEPCLSSADPLRIGQVITNLVTNALKYSPLDTPVAIAVANVGDAVRVEVRDRGQGVALAEQERIWQRFYRVRGTTGHRGTGVGLGLGLYICRSMIERHGGQIGVMSAPGKGATFWFTLPLIEG